MLQTLLAILGKKLDEQWREPRIPPSEDGYWEDKGNAMHEHWVWKDTSKNKKIKVCVYNDDGEYTIVIGGKKEKGAIECEVCYDEFAADVAATGLKAFYKNKGKTTIVKSFIE